MEGLGSVTGQDDRAFAVRALKRKAFFELADSTYVPLDDPLAARFGGSPRAFRLRASTRDDRAISATDRGP